MYSACGGRLTGHLVDYQNAVADQMPKKGFFDHVGGQIGLEGEPLPSIRLKMIRRSQQDYEYFWLLTDKLKDQGQAADRVVNRIVKRALREAVALWPNITDDPTNWSHRPGEWHDARLELAGQIQNAYRK